MIRLLILLLTRRWGLIIVGTLLLIGGLIYGATSHQVAYQSVSKGTVAHFLSGDNQVGYLEMDGSSALYVLNEGDFTPVIDGINTFGNGDGISFVYRTDNTTDIDQTSTIGTHLLGKGYTIVELTLFANSGPKVFATSDYTQNPGGFYENNWAGGGALAFVGLLIAGLAFVFPALRNKNKKQLGFNAAQSAAMGMQGQPNPYQQPYLDPSQYAQYNQYNQYPPQQPTQYPPNPNSYGQPQQPAQYPPPNSNPYGQQAQPGQYDPTQYQPPRY